MGEGRGAPWLGPLARRAGGLVLAVLAWAGVVAALDPAKPVGQYASHLWTVEDGLPQSTVEAIHQTRDGYLWLGTQEGLVRFDGVRFEVFDRRTTPEMTDGVVTAIAEAPDRSLWVGTLNGLLRFRGGQVTAFGEESGLRGRLVDAILAEADGSVWIGTRHDGGLNLYRDGRFTAYTTAQGLVDDSVLALARGRDGSLWVGTSAGLSRFRNGAFTSYGKAQGLPDTEVRAVCEDGNGTLWVGTNGGLSRLEGERFVTSTTADGLASDIVYRILADRDGNLWVGTNGGGLSRVKAGRIESYGEREGLPGNMVRSLCEDRERNLWVGIVGRGLFRLNDASFTTFGRRDGLSHEHVTSILEDRRGDLWIGTFGGGLNRLHNGAFTAYGPADGLPSDHVWSLAEDRAGDLWIGTYGAGLVRAHQGRFVSFGAAQGLSNLFVRVIMEDRAGRLWVGTRGGLNLLQGNRFVHDELPGGLGRQSVYCLHEDRRGDLWIGTSGSGLKRLSNGSVRTWTEADGLGRDTVYAIHEESDGTLWIATLGGGLSRLRDGRLTTVTSRQGLHDDTGFEILEDGSGNLWLTCNRGVFRVAMSELEAFLAGRQARVHSVVFGVDDGLRTSECNGGAHPAGWRSRDGRLWFPTIRGVSVVDPEHLVVNRVPPRVVIEQPLVDGARVPLGQPVAIPAGAHELEIHYTALSLRAPGRVRLAVRLDGFDRDWVDAGTRRVAFYTNLSPGAYRFRVKACNEDGVWSREEAVLGLTLAPHFYQTLWFALLAALALGATVLGFHRLRVRRTRRHERELERRVDDAVASLRESEERYRSFVHNFRGIAFRCHFDFRPIFFHGAVEKITGYSSEELLAGTPRWDEVIYPEDLPALLAATSEELSTVPGFSSECEYRIVRKDGQVRWVRQLVNNLCDDTGRPVMVQGALYDITKRKAMEEALRGSEARLAEAQRVAGLGTWEWIVATDELVWTEEMYRLHRRDPALGPMADFWLQSVCPEDRPEVSKRINEALAGSRPYAVDHRIVCADGSVRWVHAEAAVNRDERGEPVRMIGTALDITERRQQEEERRQLETQLLEAQKMESLGLLAGGIAHDFNNLLMAILGNADLVRLHLPPDTPARTHLDRIEAATRRAADLASQMLAYAGKGRTVVERINLSTVVEDMAHLLEAAIPDRAVLHYRLEPHLPAVEADATQIRQVVMNLILNAAEALGPGGGEIVLATGSSPLEAAALREYYLGDGLPSGRYAYLEVADSGCGMDEETRARIFDPFFSTKFTGRGLGLAAVLGIVRGHRGAIRVRSELHRGTAMRVLLPACHGPAAVVVAEPATDGTWRGEGTVLVVDDDEGVREVARSLLETLGFQVLTAADGLEGVAVFRQNQGAIRLVLLDVAMPRLDGIGALREMRRIRREVRVLLCSGYGDLESQAHLTGEEVEGFLHKPFTLSVLREQVRSALAG